MTKLVIRMDIDATDGPVSENRVVSPVMMRGFQRRDVYGVTFGSFGEMFVRVGC